MAEGDDMDKDEPLSTPEGNLNTDLAEPVASNDAEANVGDENESADVLGDLAFGDLNIEDTLQAILTASQAATPAQDIDDVEGIAGEFTTLNNTIDELNSFLDRWDERHDRLRKHIREALEEDERERQQQGQGHQGSEGRGHAGAKDS